MLNKIVKIDSDVTLLTISCLTSSICMLPVVLMPCHRQLRGQVPQTYWGNVPEIADLLLKSTYTVTSQTYHTNFGLNGLNPWFILPVDLLSTCELYDTTVIDASTASARWCRRWVTHRRSAPLLVTVQAAQIVSYRRGLPQGRRSYASTQILTCDISSSHNLYSDQIQSFFIFFMRITNIRLLIYILSCGRSPSTVLGSFVTYLDSAIPYRLSPWYSPISMVIG